jgi:hypothetical protein
LNDCRAGCLIRFWDYENGDGWVYGLVIEIIDYQYCTGKQPIKSMNVVYKNRIQIIPLSDEWVTEVTDDNREVLDKIHETF